MVVLFYEGNPGVAYVYATVSQATISGSISATLLTDEPATQSNSPA